MSDSGLVKALCPMVGGGPCSIDYKIVKKYFCV